MDQVSFAGGRASNIQAQTDCVEIMDLYFCEAIRLGNLSVTGNCETRLFLKVRIKLWAQR